MVWARVPRTPTRVGSPRRGRAGWSSRRSSDILQFGSAAGGGVGVALARVGSGGDQVRLVERGLLDVDGVDGDGAPSRSATRTSTSRSLRCERRLRHARLGRDTVARRVIRSTSDAAAGAVRCPRPSHPGGRQPDRRLQLVRDPSGDLATIVNDRDPVDQLVEDLVEVSGGRATRCTRSARGPGWCPRIWPRVRATKPVISSSGDQGGRVIGWRPMKPTAPHAAGGADEGLRGRTPVRKISTAGADDDIERSSFGPSRNDLQAVRRATGGAPVAVRVSSTEAYWPVAGRAARAHVGSAAYVVPAEDLSAATVDRRQE